MVCSMITAEVREQWHAAMQQANPTACVWHGNTVELTRSGRTVARFRVVPEAEVVASDLRWLGVWLRLEDVREF
jgi:hypothetical protein